MNKRQPEASIIGKYKLYISIGKYKLYILFQLFLSELAVSVPTEPANLAKRANFSYFTMPVLPYGISCDLRGPSPQRLMSRVQARTGILSGLAAWVGGEGRRLDLYCNGQGQAYTACPRRSC
jgi:hypothetical protein